MIRVTQKTFTRGNHKLKIPNGGATMFVLNYRRGAKYFKTYPDRSKFTQSPLLKRIYYLDDRLYFFDATTLGNFKERKYELIGEIHDLADELKAKALLYPEGTRPNFTFNKQADCLLDWCEKLDAVKARWPLEKSIKKLKSCKLMLK